MNTRSFLKTLTASALAPAGAMAFSPPPLSLEQWESRMKKKLEVFHTRYPMVAHCWVFQDKPHAFAMVGEVLQKALVFSLDLSPFQENESLFTEFMSGVDECMESKNHKNVYLLLRLMKPKGVKGENSYCWSATLLYTSPSQPRSYALKPSL